MPLLGPTLRRARVEERPRLRAILALLASLALNALLAALLASMGAFRPPGPASRPAQVALAPLSASEWRANSAIRSPESRPPAAPPDRSGKVIELPPDQPAASEPPRESKFLSDRNTRVERQTVSKYAGQYPRVARRPEAGAAGPQQPAPPRGGPARAPGPERQGRAGPAEERGVPRRDTLALGNDREGVLPPPGARAPGAPGSTPQPGPNLDVAPESLARIAGGPNMDGFRDVPEGEETWLEAREFRFATFLNQMRRAIGEVWYPRVRTVARQRDPEGTSVFFRPRTVVLAVTLDAAGRVKTLSVLESSTVDFLDEVAIAAVREAQPFPNPPHAMFERDGEARVPFAFTVFPAERGGTVRWRPPIDR